MNTENCKLLKLSSISDERGVLTFLEGSKEIPFNIKRIFHISHVPSTRKRGEHAHKKCEQVIIAVKGKFDIMTSNNKKTETYRLSDDGEALYVPRKTWVELKNFSDDAIVLVLCSDYYSKDDYIRDYKEFKKLVS